MMKHRGSSGHFQTVRTDYTKPQTPFLPNAPMVEEQSAPKIEPVRVVLPKPKHSKFQKH
jgi:hypothetical protein